MSSWLIGLTRYERQALMIGLLVFCSVLGYLFVWMPFLTHYDQLKNMVVEQQATLLWMQKAALAVQQHTTSLHEQPAKTHQISLLSLIEKSTAQLGSPKQIKPEGQQKVRIGFEQVNFLELIRWLEQLYRQHQIYVSDIRLEYQGTLGLVNANLTLYKG
jgi:type II secretory pathway component PulM